MIDLLRYMRISGSLLNLIWKKEKDRVWDGLIGDRMGTNERFFIYGNENSVSMKARKFLTS